MDFVAIDVETTGLLYYLDHIIEIAAVRFSDNKEHSSFSTLVNPGVLVPEGASRVNHITDEMLKDQPKIEDVLKPFSEFCADTPLVAHNAIFDFKFIATNLEKHYCTPPTGSLFDTYSLSKFAFPRLNNYRLSTIIEHLQIPVSKFHRAKQDARACGQVFNVILQTMNLDKQTDYSWLQKITQVTGKKELRFPVLKTRQLSLFEC